MTDPMDETTMPGGSWSPKLLMKRVLDRRPLSACRVTRTEPVVLILDTSGSMEELVELMSEITAAARRRGDLEIYTAPNGIISRRVKGRVEVDMYMSENFHRKVMRQITGRAVVYVGDFDGGDTPFELAIKNRVLWLCNEDRYEDTDEHDWCSHSLCEYPRTCRIEWVYGIEDILRVARGQKTEQRLYDEYEEDWDEEEDW